MDTILENIESLPPVISLADLGTGYLNPLKCYVESEGDVFIYSPKTKEWTPITDHPWSLNEYQEQAGRTAIYPYRYVASSRLCVAEKQRYDAGNKLEIYLGLDYPLTGLFSESGEAAGVLKKIARDEDHIVTDEAREKLIKELGDVLWYLAESCTVLGISLDELAKSNIQKLRDRQRREVLKGSGDNR